ncbi:hypothetical protein AAF712_002967 [Marasmius tenuissimus]|uniref:Protein kinase domain-containing protein n=1 Tax=Marasmius tenuissimus TaxID=585030 RepID=A0ABR3A961_9AGAR
MGTKLEDLSYEVQQELGDLEQVLKDSTRLQTLFELEGDEAQQKLDMLQHLLSLPRAKPVRSRIRKTLSRLSRHSGRFPQYPVIRNLKRDILIGNGAFADVWRGTVGVTGSVKLALKVPRGTHWERQESEQNDVFWDYEQTLKYLKSIAREAILWTRLKHPNVLPFLGIYYLNDLRKDLCLISPYMAHGHLAKFLRTQPDKLYDIALGVEYLHGEDIVHGDLKDVSDPHSFVRILN